VNEMRVKLLLLASLLVLLSPLSKADIGSEDNQEEFLFQWNKDFGEIYVSTKPITSSEAIYVRTSSSNIAKGIPSVYSISFDGSENWRVENANSTMSDMSPLVFVNSGFGECGNWPDMVLVGWSDGLFQALDAHNGGVIWQYNTEVFAWGITGSMLVESETVTIPTRGGLDRLCLNGDLQFSQPTGNGWRNGVTHVADSYWVGDEKGNLWSVTKDSSTSYLIGAGKLRHSPIALDNGDLFLHLQTSSGSTWYQFDTVNYTSTIIGNSGSGPGKPIVVNGYIITSDSQQITSINCSPLCTIVDFEEFQSNGEISEVFGNIMLPRNTVQGGYGHFELLDNGELYPLMMLTFDDDWYGTSGVESWSIDGQKYQLFVNDNANLKLYATGPADIPSIDKESSNWETMLAMLFALILISATSINLLRERFQSAFKFFILFSTILLYFTMGDVIQAWSEFVTDESPASDAWNDEWPDEWLGTQVVVFEFTNRSVVAGGLLDYTTVLDLTRAAAEEQGLPLEIIESGLGKYLVSVDDVAGEGWEYDVNGQPGTLSAEYKTIDSDSIVIWRQL
tara:strand:+ start:64 stop:1755 length:1692 start_codon:yes stop_codon:yes gene_type:complete